MSATSSRIWFLFALLLTAANLRPSITGVGPLLKAIQADLSLSATAAGVLGSLPVLMFGVMAPLARLGGRIGTERLLLAALCALFAGLLIRSAGGVVPLYSGTTLLAAGIAVSNILIPTLVKQHYPDRVPSLTTAYASTMGGVAALASGVAVPLAEVLPGGWRGSLASWAALALLAILAWIPHVARGSHGPAPKATSDTAPPPIPWRSPLAWQVSGYMGVQSTMFFVAIAWYPAYLRDEGFDAATTGWLLTLYQVAALLAGLAVPMLIRRFRDQRGIAVSLAAIGAAATLGLLLFPAGALGWMMLLGIGAGPSLILALSFMGLRSVDARMAAAMSLMAQSIGYVLATFGPLAFGAIHDLTEGWTVPLVAMLGVAVVKALCGLGAGRRLTIT